MDIFRIKTDFCYEHQENKRYHHANIDFPEQPLLHLIAKRTQSTRQILTLFVSACKHFLSLLVAPRI